MPDARPDSPPDPLTLLPLSPPVYHILLALGDEVLHGYGILQAFDRKTGGRDEILPGTLYATIGRMVDGGLLEELDEPPADSTDGRRRYYRATRHGLDVARAETERLMRLVQVARAQDLAGQPAAALPGGGSGDGVG